MTEQLEGYHFSDVARTLYDFIWSEFCDWYIEMSKGRLQGRRAAEPLAQRVLVGVLDGILRLVQPVMPFVAESIWQALNEVAAERGLPTPAKAEESVVIAPWPSYPEAWSRRRRWKRDSPGCRNWCRSVREVRNRYQVDDKTRLDVSVKCSRGGGGRLQRAGGVHRPARRRRQLDRRAGRRQAEAGRQHRAAGVRGVRVARRADRRADRDQAAGEADRRQAEVAARA